MTITVVAANDREAAPDIAGETLEGEPISLADFAGDIVVVNVWGSWCSPCHAEADDLATAAKRLASKNVHFLGIDIRDQTSGLRVSWINNAVAVDVTDDGLGFTTGDGSVWFTNGARTARIGQAIGAQDYMQAAVAVDSGNALLGRFAALRLEAEVLRDRILFTTGQLDRTPFGPAVVSHTCANDGVVEGVKLVDGRAFSVQYHPEAAAGPHDAEYLFDQFVDLMARESG